MENPQEFLDRNLEELKALQIDEVKVIDGVSILAIENENCTGCLFIDCHCKNIVESCVNEVKSFVINKVNENGLTLEDLKNEMELNSLENE